MLRKILEAFKISFILAIKIEANVLLTRSRLNRKIRAYTARIITLAEQHFIRLRILNTFLKLESELDIELHLHNQF